MGGRRKYVGASLTLAALAWAVPTLVLASAGAGSYMNQPPAGASPSMPAGSSSGGSSQSGASSSSSGGGSSGSYGGSGGSHPDSSATTEAAGGRWRSRRAALADSQPAAAREDPAVEAPDAAPGPMPLEDARQNFSTVVANFLGAAGDETGWSVVDPKTDQPVKLTLKSIDPASVAPAAKTDVFTGSALMRVGRGKRTVPVTFTVDLSGTQWKVVKYKLEKVRE